MLGLALDIGLPLIAYYALHALGATDWAALLAATAAAGIRLAAVAVWTRRVSWFAAIMLVMFGVSLALAFIDGNPRFLLLKDSFSTAALAGVFLASLLGERPLALAAAMSWRPHRAQALSDLYRDEPAARRAFRVSSLGWGIGLLIESALRIPMVYLLPIRLAVGLSTVWMVVAMVATAAWNAVYIAHAARRTPTLEALLPHPR